MISIHAPIVGCDSCTRRISSRIKNFNPRTHRGVRRDGSFEDIKPLLISIHAPIVGCDTISNISLMLKNDFNPRTHRGVRLVLWLRYEHRLTNFNPRTHRGVRQKEIQINVPLLLISIHAPIVGCDFISYRCSLSQL